MRRSVSISAALHLSILLWALVAFPTAESRDLSAQSLPVDILSPSEFTKIKAGEKDAKEEAPVAKQVEPPKPKEEPKKAPPPEQKREAVLPPPPDEKPEPAPKPEPKPEKVEPKPEPPKPEKAEAKPEPKPEKKPEKPKPVAEAPKPKPKPKPVIEKKREFDADKIAALLNKVPDPKPETPKTENTSAAAEEKPGRGQRSGFDEKMSMNEIDALRSKIAQCWNPPVGGFGEEPIRIRIRMQLNRDGTLTGQPTVMNSGDSIFFRAAADSASRAVWACQPYALPTEKYSQWSDMVLNFDPREMHGG